MKMQRGAFALGLVVGLLVGLALALGVALYITKVPVPFVNKVPQRTAEQDSAEAERNRRWDPNAPLTTRSAARAGAASDPAAVAAASPFPAPAPVPAAPGVAGATGRGGASGSTRDPAAILSGAPPLATAGAAPASGAAASARPVPAATPPRSTAAVSDAFVYFVQAGAYTRTEDAERQRARLGLMGHTANVTEREQSGRTIYRVRLGPFRSRDEADALQQRLNDAAVETQIVRVERS